MTIDELLSRMDGVKHYNGYAMAKCPLHNTKDSSLKVCVGDDGRILLDCKGGCQTSDILNEMGLTFADLFPDDQQRPNAAKDFKLIERPSKKQKKPWKPRTDVVVSYEYRDDAGHLLAVKDRFYDGDKKQQYWRHQDKNGSWFYGTGGAELSLYKHECIGNPVYLVEGEKDVDTLIAGGLHAVTNPNGAGEKWQERYSEQLRGFDVCVIPDNDDVGKKHALAACTALQGIATSVRLVDLSELWPEIPMKGDVTDYVHWCRTAGRKDVGIFKSIEVLRENTPEFVRNPDAVPEEEKKLDYSKITAANVGEIDFSQTPEVEFYIDGILAQGVTFLNAFSKVGKSRMIVQMLLAICNGASFLQHQTKQSAVLYLALEDERIDFENRMKKFLRDAPQPRNFYYVTKEAFKYNTPTLDDDGGLLPFLKAQIDQNPNIKVIAIDVFGVIRSKRRVGEDFAVHERRDVDALIKFAAEHNQTLLIAHHVSKAGLHQMRLSSTGSGAGSYVISGTVHAELEIALDGEDEKRARFSVKGRRMKSARYAIRDDFPFWQLEGDWEAVTFADDPVVATVKWLVKQYGQWRGSIKQLLQVNNENDFLPKITKSLNKNSIENLARQFQTNGIRYIQHPNGNASPTHEFIRADIESSNSFIELSNTESWKELKINSSL